MALAPIGDAVGLPGVTRDADVGGQAADRGVELGVGVALDGHAVVDHQAVSVHEAHTPNEEERADVPSRRPQRAGAQSGKHKPHRRGPEKDRRDGHPVLEVADREVEVVRQNPGEGVQEDGGAEERERRPGCRREPQRDQGQQKGDDHEGGGGSQRLGNAWQAVGEAAADGEEGRREGPADVGDGVLEGKHFQAALWPEGGLALRFGQRVDGTGVGARERVGKPGHRAEQDEQCVPLQPPHDRAPRPEQPEDPLGGDDHRHGGGIDDRGNHGARESSPFAPRERPRTPQRIEGKGESPRQPARDPAGHRRGVQEKKDKEQPAGQADPSRPDQNPSRPDQDPQAQKLDELGGGVQTDKRRQDPIDQADPGGDEGADLVGDRITLEEAGFAEPMEGEESLRIVRLETQVRQISPVGLDPERDEGPKDRPQQEAADRVPWPSGSQLAPAGRGPAGRDQVVPPHERHDGGPPPVCTVSGPRGCQF